MHQYQANTKNKKMFELIDKLDEHKEEMEYYAIGRRPSNRLDKIESNAIEIEKIASEIQNQVKSMRRK
ncbi:hypothetical protein JOC34_000521 [Virgibacillus halotolerans]|uniref:hypothetical protein n=1 Tax=Virgibacillus halotolerans TaxID=1071053 RepID=UPI001960450E|nr:hypothetical protein [Virgibacillus halotolerans]MBM7598164.1 hypothetical protein [Virgibacillus halotolerans]